MSWWQGMLLLLGLVMNFLVLGHRAVIWSRFCCFDCVLWHSVALYHLVFERD